MKFYLRQIHIRHLCAYSLDDSILQGTCMHDRKEIKMTRLYIRKK